MSFGKGLRPWASSIAGIAPWNSADSSAWDGPTNWYNRAGARPVTLIHDPSGLYPDGGSFTMADLVVTAAFGYWPEGARFEIRYKQGNDRARDLIVRGGALVDLATGEWMLAKTHGRFRWVKPGEETIQLLVDRIN